MEQKEEKLSRAISALARRKILKLLADKKLYRLMGCLNFEKKNGYFIFKGNDLFEFKKKGDKIIHWLPFRKGLANVEVLMPDKKIVSGLAELSVLELKKGEVIQFERFGFCRLDRKYKNKLFFWFSHK